MRIGERVYCYNVRNGKEGDIHFSTREIKVGEFYTITNIDIRNKDHKRNHDIHFKNKYDYVFLDSISFPIRVHGCKKKYDGVEVAYFDKFFITQREYRKQKLQKLNSL